MSCPRREDYLDTATAKRFIACFSSTTGIVPKLYA